MKLRRLACRRSNKVLHTSKRRKPQTERDKTVCGRSEPAAENQSPSIRVPIKAPSKAVRSKGMQSSEQPGSLKSKLHCATVRKRYNYSSETLVILIKTEFNL